ITRREIFVAGPLDQVLAVRLPGEVMLNLMADRFDSLVARWAYVGLPALVGDRTSQEEHRLRCRRAIERAGRLPMAPTKFFAVKDASDPEFIALSHGLCEFLLQRKDQATLLAFIGDGKAGWEAAARKHYGFASLRDLE